MDGAHYTLVNLRVLSKLKPGNRLQTVDSRYFGIDDGTWSWFWRWLRADGRANCVDRIEETFANAKKHNISETLIQSAKTGVEKLCATYSDDQTTVARLETIINHKIEVAKEEPGTEF